MQPSIGKMQEFPRSIRMITDERSVASTEESHEDRQSRRYKVREIAVRS